MITGGRITNQSTASEVLSADHFRGSVMSDKSDNNTVKKSWSLLGTKHTSDKEALFKADELDIYCNKVTAEVFIFHGKPINYDTISHLEYDHKNRSVDVVLKNGAATMDLGVRIGWIVRAYFAKADEVSMAQTANGQSVAGVVLSLKHKNKK